MTKHRVAILLEITDSPLGLPALRRFLKALARAYGIKCLAVAPPADTQTFGPAQATEEETSRNAADDQ